MDEHTQAATDEANAIPVTEIVDRLLMEATIRASGMRPFAVAACMTDDGYRALLARLRAICTGVTPEAVKTGHEMVLTVDGGAVDWRLVCHEPADADCQYICPCCESWGVIDRDDNGQVHHVVDHGDGPVQHLMVRSDGCIVADWLNTDSDLIPELSESGRFTAARFPVEARFDPQAGTYLWRPTRQVEGS